MSNLYQGIPVIVIATLLIVFAFRMQQKQRAVWLLVLAGFILRFYCSADQFLHPWDERYHALVAKNFMTHWWVPTLYDNPILGYNNASWAVSHIWLHKQPLPMWLMAISMKLFGVNEMAMRLPSVIMTSIGIKLMYDIALYYYNRNTAFIAAFLFTIQGTIIDLAAGRWATDHIDTAFLFFTLASIWFTIRYLKSDKTGNNIAAGLMMGCAIFTKWLPALIILPVWVLLIADAQKTIKLKTLIQLVVFLVSATVVVLPWQLYIRRYFPAEAAIEFGHMGRHFT